MSTEAEIQRVLTRYATAIDTRDWVLLRTCFTADVNADYGDIGTWPDVDELVAFMAVAHAGFGATNHMLSNFVIDVDDSSVRACASTYVHAVLTLDDAPGTWFDTVGLYDDVLVRTEDGWRISDRTFRATRMTTGTQR